MKFESYTINITQNVYWLILLLCTQASFFNPFFILHDLYTIEDLNIYIIQDTDTPIIDIIDNNTCIEIIFQKKFLYKNIDTREIITTFYTFIVIKITLHQTTDGYIFNDRKYGAYTDSKIYLIKNNNLIII